MFELLSGVTTSPLLVFAFSLVFAYVTLLSVVFGILALMARRAGPPELYRIGPVIFRFRPIRCRLRLWQYMVAILAVGSLVEVAIVAGHAFSAYRKAEMHASKASFQRSLQNRSSPRDHWLRFIMSSKPLPPEYLKYCRAVERHHEELSEKHFDIARHPWRSVSPDPPEPDLTEFLFREFGLPAPGGTTDIPES